MPILPETSFPCKMNVLDLTADVPELPDLIQVRPHPGPIGAADTRGGSRFSKGETRAACIT